MKLIGLYEYKELKNVEENHLNFCQKNGIEYQKIYIQNYDEKWRNVYTILDENPNGEFLFIDSYSFFKTEKFNFYFEKDIFIEGFSGKILDNFFFVRSTTETRKVFFNNLLKCRKQLIEKKLFCDPQLPIDVVSENYPRRIDGFYFNLNINYIQNYHQLEEVIVCNHRVFDKPNLPISEIILKPIKSTYSEQQSDFQVINPGYSKAFISIYTPEINNYGRISEDNISRWCQSNNTTYYIYRKLPDNLSTISGNWTKPYLILEHIEDHDCISWIDSDILILGHINIDYEKDVSIYCDPACWFMNSGFMTFRKTQKNIELIKSIIKKIESVQDKSSVYASGGDQPIFEDEIKKYYPDIIPHSNLKINSILNYHFFNKPEEINAMIHFMGYHSEVRRHLMDYYNEIAKLVK
jgi:hypothetical protein